MASNRYFFSRGIGWALTACVGLQLVAGILAVFIPDDLGISARVLRATCAFGFAGTCLFALAAGNCCAAHACAAFSMGRAGRHVFVPAAMLSVLFCGAALLGVDLGWAVLKADDGHPAALPWDGFVVAASFLLAPAKPALAWIVEGRIALDRLRTLEEERGTISLAAERERLQDRQTASRGGIRHGVSAVVASAAAFGLLSPSDSHAAPIGAPLSDQASASHSGTVECKRRASRNAMSFTPRDTSAYETVREMVASGKRACEIRVPVSRSTKYRWAARARRTASALHQSG